MVYRIFVEKKAGLDNEAKALLNEAKNLLGIEKVIIGVEDNKPKAIKTLYTDTEFFYGGKYARFNNVTGYIITQTLWCEYYSNGAATDMVVIFGRCFS